MFMLSNPLFSVPAVAGIGYFASRHVNGQSASRLATNVVVNLGLRGLAVGADIHLKASCDTRCVRKLLVNHQAWNCMAAALTS